MRQGTRSRILAAVLSGALVVLAEVAANGSKPGLDVAKARVVDLTHSFDEKTIYWPNSPSTFKLTKLAGGKRWPDRKRYLGDDTPGAVDHLHFPSYGKEAVELLVRERRVAALGLDRLWPLEGLYRPPDRQRRQCSRPRKHRESRGSPGDRRLDRRPPDEDRRRLGRASPDRGPGSLRIPDAMGVSKQSLPRSRREESPE